MTSPEHEFEERAEIVPRAVRTHAERLLRCTRAIDRVGRVAEPASAARSISAVMFESSASRSPLARSACNAGLASDQASGAT